MEFFQPMGSAFLADGVMPANAVPSQADWDCIFNTDHSQFNLLSGDYMSILNGTYSNDIMADSIVSSQHDNTRPGPHAFIDTVRFTKGSQRCNSSHTMLVCGLLG
jgi:hypothetical protein